MKARCSGAICGCVALMLVAWGTGCTVTLGIVIKNGSNQPLDLVIATPAESRPSPYDPRDPDGVGPGAGPRVTSGEVYHVELAPGQRWRWRWGDERGSRFVGQGGVVDRVVVIERASANRTVAAPAGARASVIDAPVRSGKLVLTFPLNSPGWGFVAMTGDMPREVREVDPGAPDIDPELRALLELWGR